MKAETLLSVPRQSTRQTKRDNFRYESPKEYYQISIIPSVKTRLQNPTWNQNVYFSVQNCVNGKETNYDSFRHLYFSVGTPKRNFEVIRRVLRD